ncbi:MAG TPA: GntR family transcriptional regulator, partial [Candidatus Avidesulfovibrio excrementigallinarum]|nr:GntR family transcriptional regulator [Candidatus Avidesulfovibrio excrementigallinarum]
MRYPETNRVIVDAKAARLPVYIRIAQSIQEDIEKSRWQIGEMIPAEPQLAQTHQASIGTVKKALQLLVSAGLLYRVQGKGTFVAGSFLRSDQLRFYRTQESFLSMEESTAAKFISCKVIPPQADINAQLQIAPDAALIELRRLIFSNGQRLVDVHSYFEQSRFPKLADETPSRFEKQALTLIIENDYGTPTMSTEELISVVTPQDRTIAELL